MGLDQYAFSAPEPLTVIKNPDGEFEIKGVHGEEFYWRKHAKLQAFFEASINLGILEPLVDGAFNCNPVMLTLDTVKSLEQLLKDDVMPESEGGFFYGHQFQDEAAAEYREQDIKFCQWAKDTIKGGDYVYYDCWW